MGIRRDGITAKWEFGEMVGNPGIRCFAIFCLAVYPVAPDIRLDIDYPVDIR